LEQKTRSVVAGPPWGEETPNGSSRLRNPVVERSFGWLAEVFRNGMKTRCKTMRLLLAAKFSGSGGEDVRRAVSAATEK